VDEAILVLPNGKGNWVKQTGKLLCLFFALSWSQAGQTPSSALGLHGGEIDLNT
jgi:hypothetical protein